MIKLPDAVVDAVAQALRLHAASAQPGHIAPWDEVGDLVQAAWRTNANVALNAFLSTAHADETFHIRGKFPGTEAWIRVTRSTRDLALGAVATLNDARIVRRITIVVDDEVQP